MRTLIKGGRIVNEGKTFDGVMVIDGELIADVLPSEVPVDGTFDNTIDATGCYILPGVIDSHVHFRDPGLTEKADMDTESRAAAAGGVTSFFDMPNTMPQTTTLEALEEKFGIAARKSHVNYSFFFGATNENCHLFPLLDPQRIPGIKLFMGSSTGNMLVDSDDSLERIFSLAPLPLMAHCEDTAIINQNMASFKERYGDDPPVWAHQLIRNEEACLASTSKAIALATKHQARLHIAHISTEAELEMIPANSLHSITAEATVGHLLFSTVDYDPLGTRIKVNPAIKSVIDQEALRRGLNDGRISTIATDHAPHLLSQKQGGCARAASGMPMIQFSLPSMLELVDEDVLTFERMVELMAHNPARIFDVRRRGFLRKGYQADLVIVRPNSPWTLTPDIILSKCGWSPLEGHEFHWRVETTFCNGYPVYQNGHVAESSHGQPILFR
ncbi:MAG: dihydroorotase [Prevotella sp.]|nr:dihydroorotase [Prevotella sp.]